MELSLIRQSDDGKRTRGILRLPDGTTFYTLEEPWKDNKQGISCVPKGVYRVRPHGWEANSKLKFKRVWRLDDAQTKRTAILIHAGNTTDDIEGCILVGLKMGILKGKDAVLQSQAAIEHLRQYIGEREFTLVIA